MTVNIAANIQQQLDYFDVTMSHSLTQTKIFLIFHIQAGANEHPQHLPVPASNDEIEEIQLRSIDVNTSINEETHDIYPAHRCRIRQHHMIIEDGTIIYHHPDAVDVVCADGGDDRQHFLVRMG